MLMPVFCCNSFNSCRSLRDIPVQKTGSASEASRFNNLHLVNEAEYLTKNYGDRGGSNPSRP